VESWNRVTGVLAMDLSGLKKRVELSLLPRFSCLKCLQGGKTCIPARSDAQLPKNANDSE
jgi:hypothetical protein